MFFCHLACGQIHYSLGGGYFRCSQIHAITGKKDVGHHEAGALFAIYKRVVANDPGRISRGEGGEIEFVIGMELLRPIMAGSPESVIADFSNPH